MMASNAYAPSKRITTSLRRAILAVALAAIAAATAAGPAGATTTTWDPNCPSGCAIAAVTDGTSNTIQVGEAVQLDPSHKSMVVTPGSSADVARLQAASAAKIKLPALRVATPRYTIVLEDVLVSSLAGGSSFS